MPFVLSIDCCSRWTNVGCSCNGTILGEVHLNIGRNQSSQLPLVVEGLLRSIDKTFHDVDFLAVTTGPGYFTGLRVGVAYAMALAEALNVPVVPVNTLEAMIFDLLHEGPLFLPLLWARETRCTVPSTGHPPRRPRQSLFCLLFLFLSINCWNFLENRKREFFGWGKIFIALPLRLMEKVSFPTERALGQAMSPFWENVTLIELFLSRKSSSIIFAAPTWVEGARRPRSIDEKFSFLFFRYSLHYCQKRTQVIYIQCTVFHMP